MKKIKDIFDKLMHKITLPILGVIIFLIGNITLYFMYGYPQFDSVTSIFGHILGCFLIGTATIVIVFIPIGIIESINDCYKELSNEFTIFSLLSLLGNSIFLFFYFYSFIIPFITEIVERNK